MTTDNVTLTAALGYAARGWPVLPLHSIIDGRCTCGADACGSPGKHPIGALAPHGVKDATTDPATIKRWWQQRPMANVGIATGAASGLVAIDIDPRHGGTENLADLLAEHGALPETVESTTGGDGRHILFAHPGQAITRKAIAEGIDVKADGGYIVAPPSNHISGKSYAWEASSDPKTTPLAALPAWLLDLLTTVNGYKSATEPATATDRRPSQYSQVEAVAWARSLLARLAPWRCDAYQGAGGWVDVGMALCELGPDGLELWDTWSQRSTKYPGPEALERKWATFTPGEPGGLTLGSLYAWAEHDTPRPVAAATVAPAPSGQAETPAADAPDLPEIVTTGRPMRTLTDDAMDAWTKANASPAVFVRSGELTRIGQNEHGLPVIEPMTEAAVRGRIDRCAQFTRLRKRREDDPWQHIPMTPPIEVVRDIMALGRWPFPALVGIIEAPTLRQDGHLLTAPGYDPDTRLYYIPAAGLNVPPIPDRPTEDDKQAAIGLLREIIANFPFEDDASRANALAAMITPVARPMIPGPVPMVLFDKPQAGTGASLLAEVVALIATGRPSAMFTAPADDEGWKKEITSLLLQGRQVITVDNIEGRLFSPSLAAVLTASLWEDRILGQSKSATLIHRAVWIGTGNNIRLGGDLPRRCYWVRMDAQEARPWERSADTFKHPDLCAWVGKERGRILAAILTLARAWVTAGKVKDTSLPTLGGFESWARTIGGILINAKVGGFLGNLVAMYEQADDDTPQWEIFMAAWRDKWPDKYITTPDVAAELASNETLRGALPMDLADYTDKGFTRRLGKALARRNMMRFPNGLCVKSGAKEKKANTWQVVEVKPKS